MDTQQKVIEGVIQLPKEVENLDQEFIDSYLQMCIRSIAATYARRSIIAGIMSFLVKVVSIGVIAGSVFVFQNTPIESMIICLCIMSSYSILTGVNKNVTMEYAKWCDTHNTINQMFFPIIIMPIGAAIIGIIALWYHISIIMAEVTTSSPYLFYFYWGYPILLLCITGIRYALENKYFEYQELCEAVRNLTPEDIALTITHQT